MDMLLAAAWIVSTLLSVWGTACAIWRARWRRQPRCDSYPPVSILKPLKGVDPGLAENLSSFLDIDYPNYEVIFSVADPGDPAMGVVSKLAERPNVTLVYGGEEIGINPKVNNLVVPERCAANDRLLISDSNIRAHRSYLKELVPTLSGDIGVVTAAVRGFGGTGRGGSLEEMQLNTYYARWMYAADSVGQAFVLGKSMYYQRSVGNLFGGVAALSNYLAEDYMMGLSMNWIGKKIDMMDRPVSQFVGAKTVTDFWKRNYRWAVLQKHSAPAVFVAEPLSFAFVVSAVGAVGFSACVPWWVFFPLSVLLYFALDAVMCRWFGGTDPDVGTWALKEALAPLIWLHAAFCDTVEWRGTKIRVLAKGLAKKAG